MLNDVPNVILLIVSWLTLACSIGLNDPRYLGCLKLLNRHDHNTNFFKRNLTISRCINYCVSRGFAYTAVGVGNWCSCIKFGESFNKYSSSNDCTVPCVGNASEICGGRYEYNHQRAESVFRACVNHKFGLNCTKSCHCGKEQNSVCDPVKGQCYGGDQRCEPGWRKWPECQSVCPAESNEDGCTSKSTRTLGGATSIMIILLITVVL